jgi:hypothetical protein
MRATSVLALLVLASCGKPETPSPDASAARVSPLERAAGFGDKDAADRHEGWLAVVEDLEAERSAQPRSVAVLRDLLVAYGQLLAFERTTALGSNVCLVASRRMKELEELASPLGDADRDLVWHMRAWLAFVMGMPPLAAEACSTMKSSEAAAEIRSSLEALGQRTYEEGRNFACGPLRVRPFINRGASPAEDALWPERCYVAAPLDDAALHRTTMIAVCRMDGRWSMWLHALNRRELLLPLGEQRPDEKLVRSHVIRILRDTGGSR